MSICEYIIFFLMLTAIGSLLFWLGPYDRWAARKRDAAQAEYTKEWMEQYNQIRDWHLARSLQENEHETYRTHTRK